MRQWASVDDPTVGLNRHPPPRSFIPPAALAFRATHWSDKCISAFLQGRQDSCTCRTVALGGAVLRDQMHCTEQCNHGLAPRPAVRGHLPFLSRRIQCGLGAALTSTRPPKRTRNRVSVSCFWTWPSQRGCVSQSLRGPGVCILVALQLILRPSQI